MSRKTAEDLKSVDKLLDMAYEQFAFITAVKAELAQEVYDAQDAETKRAINTIKSKLRQLVTDTIILTLENGGKAEAQITAEDLEQNVLWLAVEIVKDLAIVGVQVANFKFPTKSCAICGGDV